MTLPKEGKSIGKFLRQINSQLTIRSCRLQDTLVSRSQEKKKQKKQRNRQSNRPNQETIHSRTEGEMNKESG
jgi:Sec-independent protein translocase protein TatA